MRIDTFFKHIFKEVNVCTKCIVLGINIPAIKKKKKESEFDIR
jgi:hypothetical protein